MFNLFKKNNDKIWKKYKNELLLYIAKILFNAGVFPSSIEDNDVKDALEEFIEKSETQKNKKSNTQFSKIKNFFNKFFYKNKKEESPITLIDSLKNYKGLFNGEKQTKLNNQFRTIDFNFEDLQNLTLSRKPMKYHSKYKNDDKQFLENSILSIDEFNNNDFYDKENKFDLNKARNEMNKWGNKQIKKAIKEFLKNSNESTIQWNFDWDEDIAYHSQQIVNSFCQYLPNNLTARIKNINVNSCDRIAIINMEFAFKDENDIYVFSSFENLTPYESLLIR